MQQYKIIISIIFVILLNSCNSADNKETNNKITINYSGKPKIEFQKKEFDFGTLKEGEIVECTFTFKNIGTAPLKITSVDADCGCTVPQYSTDEILPGKEGQIKTIFNSDGFRNNIFKTIDVETNADSIITELTISAFIESKFKLN